VVVAAGQSVHRDGPVSALELAARAADRALAQVEALRSRIERVSMVSPLSSVGLAPATAAARTLGLSSVRTEVSTIGGNSPQWLVNRAAADIAAGHLDAVLVMGAEAQHAGRVHPASAPEASLRDGASVEADPVVGDDRSGVGQPELDARAVAPVHVYALFESAIEHRSGRTHSEHRDVLGQVMAPFTDVAATNPFSWFQKARAPAELTVVTTDNRMVAEPYTKRLCAVLDVNQGAAVLVTSLALARTAGVAERAVFVWSGASANDVWFPSARPDLATSPALETAANAALGVAGLGVDDMAALDVYSCFPCAVEMATEALGVEPTDQRGLTVTGGLPYFGGPGNNYALHAIAAMTDRLRDEGGHGLVSALGWYVTKHAVGIYGASPPPAGWRTGDTTAAQRAIDATALEVVASANGLAEVRASTVVYARDGTVVSAPVIGELPDGRRVVAAAVEDELPSLSGRNLSGSRITVSGHSPPRYRVVT
jgi:acetyl-CoA C-acetyltransferase